jgi:hypothetical protein
LRLYETKYLSQTLLVFAMGFTKLQLTRTLGPGRAFPSSACSAFYKISHSRYCRFFADRFVSKRLTALRSNSPCPDQASSFRSLSLWHRGCYRA